MATATDKELEALKNQYESLKSDLAEMTQTVTNLARDGVEEGRQRTVGAVQQRREQARETWGVVEKEIEERPITTLAVALGVGFILGKLMSR